MSQNSLQIFMRRSYVAFNIEIWRSVVNLNGVELSEEWLSLIRESDSFGIIPKKIKN